MGAIALQGPCPFRDRQIDKPANAALADLHDRMPVVISEDAWARWLTPSPADTGELMGLLVPNESIDLRIQAVSRLVNDVRQDGPALIEPLTAVV